MNAPAFPATFNSEPHYKRQFAAFVYQGYTPFLAALKMWPQDNNFAYNVSESWKADAFVLAEIEKLRTDAEAKARAPTKEELIKDLRQRANGMEDDDFIKAFRLIAEMSGHIAKPEPPQTNVTVNNTQNRVMVVKDHGSAADWEAKLVAQQAKLVGNG